MSEKKQNGVESIHHKADKKSFMMKPASIFLIAVLVGMIGYVAGVNHYKIEAAIGPIFGYKTHNATIDLSSVEATYNKLVANFDGELDTQELIYGANRGLVEAAGDAYTQYMSPTEAEEFDKELSGNIGGGIGAQIGEKNDNIVIIKPLKDNPAIRAGIQANDIVTMINDESTVDMTVDDAVAKIRGEEGTTVKLTILRGTEIKEFNVTRAIINNPSVDSSMDGTIGMIVITRFDDETGYLARAAANKLLSDGAKSIILDLRGNGGGYVDSAVSVAGLWLNEKVVTVQKSGSEISKTLTTGNEAILVGVPTVVLVNGASASASEIVAGSLHDHNAAQLVGETTYGKGSVQQPITLEGGSLLKVTVAKWYTPNDKNITKEGIAPDFVVEYTQEDIDKNIDPQYDKAKSLLQS